MTATAGRLRAGVFSLVLMCTLLAPCVARAEFVATSGSATMVSLSGDYIGQGADRLFDAPGTLSIEGGLGHVELMVSSGKETWRFEFEPASGGQLEAGEFPNAQRSASKGTPGLEVAGDGRGCNTVYGWFDIKDIHVDLSGNVDRFWALYEQHCESRESPALFGEIRVGEPASGEPEETEPAAIRWPSTSIGISRPHVPVAVIGGGSGGNITSVGLEGADPGDFTITGDGCIAKSLSAGERCEVDVAAKPIADGSRTAELVISDVSGAKTTIPLEVFGTGVPQKEVTPEETRASLVPPEAVRSMPSGVVQPAASGPQPPHVVIKPIHRRKPIPDLFVELGAVRKGLVSPVTHAVTSYQYYFSAKNIHCVNGANRVILDVSGHQHFAPCKSSLVVVGGAVAPRRNYTVFVEAVVMRKHRIKKLGAAYTRRMYMPGEEANWRPVTGKPPVI